jgi:hypothetical protein
MKALGICAMVVAIFAIFLPILGPYVTPVAALLAAFAAGEGLTFSIVALVLNAVNIVFLSPSLYLTAGGEAMFFGTGGVITGGLVVMLLGAQVIAAIVLGVVHSNTKKPAIGT